MASMAQLHDEQELVDNTAEFIDNFLDTRFTGELPPDWREALFDVCLTMFESGAAWADATSEREGKTIIMN